jgi:hypothetical protein
MKENTRRSGLSNKSRKPPGRSIERPVDTWEHASGSLYRSFIEKSR